MGNNIKAIALYLPQFHPIPENDEWWGKGFTEWTNVTKAQPLFDGHWQPRLPADLGFYDLRVPEVRQAQADLAKQYGINGFCYWHYWFAGKRVLERPFQEVVKSGKPDFPFCLAWANQTWSGTWHGLSNKKMLIEQTYPGEQDYIDHFYANLEAFRDSRYIEVNGKKLFFVFCPLDIPDAQSFINCWQKLAKDEGIGGIHFVGMDMPDNVDCLEYGYDAFVPNWRPKEFLINKNKPLAKHKTFFGFQRKAESSLPIPRIMSYHKYTNQYLQKSFHEKEYPLICCDWDNTPRSGIDGWLFKDFSFDDFYKICYKSFESTENKQPEEKIVLIKSWNEWAEGNYMEPDQKNSHKFLKTFNEALLKFNSFSHKSF